MAADVDRGPHLPRGQRHRDQCARLLRDPCRRAVRVSAIPWAASGSATGAPTVRPTTVTATMAAPPQTKAVAPAGARAMPVGLRGARRCHRPGASPG